MTAVIHGRRATRAAYHRDRRRALAYGTWCPTTDASPVRDHLLRLRAAGLTVDVVAARSGVPAKTLHAIAQGARSRTRRETAEAVLAVCPPSRARLDDTARLTRRLWAVAQAGGAGSDELAMVRRADKPADAALALALETAAGRHHPRGRVAVVATRVLLRHLDGLPDAERRIMAALLTEYGVSVAVAASSLDLSRYAVYRAIKAQALRTAKRVA